LAAANTELDVFLSPLVILMISRFLRWNRCAGGGGEINLSINAVLIRIGVTGSRDYLQYCRHAFIALAAFIATVRRTLELIFWIYLFVSKAALYLVGVGVSRRVELHADESPASCDV
jgi:hypothetical protein